MSLPGGDQPETPENPLFVRYTHRINYTRSKVVEGELHRTDHIIKEHGVFPLDEIANCWWYHNRKNEKHGLPRYCLMVTLKTSKRRVIITDSGVLDDSGPVIEWILVDVLNKEEARLIKYTGLALHESRFPYVQEEEEKKENE